MRLKSYIHSILVLVALLALYWIGVKLAEPANDLAARGARLSVTRTIHHLEETELE